MKAFHLTLMVGALCLGSPAGFAAEAPAVKKLAASVRKSLSTEQLAKVFRALEAAKPSVAGPKTGEPCATENRTTAETNYRDQSIPCTVDGKATTCKCDLTCEYVCESKKATEDCTPTACSYIEVPGASGVHEAQHL